MKLHWILSLVPFLRCRWIRVCSCPFVVLFSCLDAEPVRVVSQTVGTDELLLALADPEQIAALSHISTERDFSAVSEAAKAYPQLDRGDAETILKYRPTLVLAADYSRAELIGQVERAGVRVMRFENYHTLEDAFANLRRLAAELGPAAEQRAETIIASTRERAARLRERLAGVEPVRVIAPSTYGVIGGAETTFQDLCDHAGAENLATTLGGLVGHATTPREAILTWPIDFVVVAGDDPASAVEPYLRLPPFQFLAAVKERRVAVIDTWMLASVSHHRVTAYEHLARELHPDRFGEDKDAR